MNGDIGYSYLLMINNFNRTYIALVWFLFLIIISLFKLPFEYAVIFYGLLLVQLLLL